MIHKLADGPITMEIARIELTDGKFGAQYRWVGTDGTEVFISETSTTRGLDRLKLDAATAVGETLTLFQVKKDGKTYTNIERAGSAAAARSAVAPTAAEPVAPAASKRSLEQLGDLYEQCLNVVLATLVKRCEQHEIPLDGAAVQAATATLFIAAK
jgi:hypothetical protein